MRQKVTVVGAGGIGATVALQLAHRRLGSIVLIDVVEGLAQGRAIDIIASAGADGSELHVDGHVDYSVTADSDVVVIAAGFPRKPGMTRDDLVLANYETVVNVTRQAVKHSPNCILLVVTNPLDAMCWTALQVSGFPRHRVIGMGSSLDALRFRVFIAAELHVSVECVSAIVLGGHGDTMVLLPRLCSVSGVPLTELIEKETLERLIERTRNGGAEVVKHLKWESARYAPATAVVEMVESIVFNKRKVIACSAYLDGEYGIKGLFMGVPVKLGTQGIEKIYELRLDEDETAAFSKSARAVRELVDIVGERWGTN